MTRNFTIRLFVSSTFADMKAERDLLQREVFPRLRKKCSELGLRFQAIDLRWGVSDEAGHENRTMRICLRELKRCQSSGPRPNFLILLGDRYGWCPLPEIIPADLFEKLEKAVNAEDAKTAELLRSCYRRDDNAVPPACVLQPRRPPLHDATRWSAEVETPLFAALRRAVRTVGLESEAASLHLGLAATHQEILHGALSLPEADVRPHVHAFVRSIRLPEGQSLPGDFTDLTDGGAPNPEAKQQLGDLRGKLAAHLTAENVHGYSVDWREGGKFTDADLKQFHDDVVVALEAVITAQAQELSRIASGDQEENAHRAFAAERRAGFVGREAELKRVADYLAGIDARPLLILGPAGSGKSAFMAQAADRARQDHLTALLIERYIGATPSSSRAVSVLHDLVQRLRAAYPVASAPDSDGKPKPDDEIPIEFNPLVSAFHESLKRVTLEKPLVLFLDALDQFSGTDLDSIAAWLPTTLPVGVRLVVSTAQPAASAASEKTPQARVHAILTGRLPAETHLLLPPLQRDHGGQMLDRWLAVASRTLLSEQRAGVLRAFTIEGNPLWLRTAAEEVARLPSWASAPELPPTVGDLIRRLLERLSRESEHGAVLVDRALGYLACSRHGLSEDEMLDLLSGDAEVMADFRRRFPKSPSVEALPVATWVPLLGDIFPFLGEHEAHGASLLRFYHRVLLETVENSFLAETDKRLRNQQVMAAYFTRQARGTNADRIWESINARGFAECVYHQANSQSWEDVERTLSDFAFLMQKTRLGLLDGIFEDWAILEAQAPENTRLHLQGSRAFFREKAHILRRGNAEWPAHKILLQLAIEHADDSSLTLGAEHWLRENRCDWLWFRRVPRLPQLQTNPCVAVLEGHLSSVIGAMQMPDGWILSWSSDHTLRLWDSRNGLTLQIMAGHSDRVCDALLLPQIRILSWSRDKTLRLWDARNGACLAVFQGHTDAVDEALILSSNRVVSRSADVTGGVECSHDRRG